MYFLHVRVSGLLGRDDFMDAVAWQQHAQRSLAEGATFVLMHEGSSALHVADVAPVAAHALPVGIYLTEPARLAIDATLVGPVDFVASTLMQPLYRLRLPAMPTTATDRDPAATSIDAPAAPPVVESVSAEAKRGRGRPRKDASANAPAVTHTPPVNLAEAYPSSREFFAAVLDEGKNPRVAALKAYLGFRKEQRSIDELAADSDITRQGMHQRIQSLVEVHCRNPEVAAVVARIRQLMEEASEPLFLAEVPYRDAWFRSEDVLESGFADYLDQISAGGIHCLPTANGPVLSRVSTRLWKEAGTQLRKWLVDLDARDTVASIDELNAKAQQCLPDNQPDSFVNLLVESIDEGRVRRARLPGGEEVVAGFGVGIRPMVRAILLESEHPLHQEEILRRLTARFQPTQSEVSIRNEVSSSALPFQRSTYGLRKHIGLTEEDLLEVISAAESVASGSPDRQWTTDQIANELREKEHLTGFGINARRINLILKAGPTVLHDHGRGVWSLDGKVPRRQIHDIVVEALQCSGRPMTNEELRQEVEKSRGTGETFQIQPRDNLIQVARATWGLIERDLPIPEADAKEWLQALVAAVAEAGRGVHVDEVAEVLAARGRDVAELGDVALLSALARRFGGLTITPSRYFILPEWSDERRITPRQAIEVAIEDHPDKTSAQLAQIVSASCGMTVNKNLVLNVLGDLGYGFDSEARRWVRVDDDT